jgi:mRNA-degrading endonuclease toxin of MazEF toxin-antitoxin module
LLQRSSGCVAKRAEVLVARRRLGFGAGGRKEHFVVLQSDLLSSLETAVVAPLDEDASIYADDPLAVHVTGKEAGTKTAQVVLVHLLAAVSLERFEAAPVGHLSAKSMVQVGEALCTVLQL